MNDNTIDLDRIDDEVLTSEVSDEARLLRFGHRRDFHCYALRQ
jgi:hypothetical protein